MSMLLRTAVIFGLLLTALVPPVAAQRGVQGRRGLEDREQLENRVRAQMGRFMRERLGLDSAQAARLSAVVEDFEGQRRELFALEQATRLRVGALLLDGADDQDEARALLARMWELRAQEAELFRAEQEALLEVLTPTQVLQLQELRQDLGQRIRALRDGRGGGRGQGFGRGTPRGGRIGAAGPPPRGAPPGPQRII